jgi:hypothetical protein
MSALRLEFQAFLIFDFFVRNTTGATNLSGAVVSGATNLSGAVVSGATNLSGAVVSGL